MVAKQSTSLRAFQGALLDDLRALETMLRAEVLERGVQRIGAEQEMFLVDAHGHPALLALEVLARTKDPHLVTEIGLFKLEANLTPIVFSGGCLAQLEAELQQVLGLAQAASSALGAKVLLTGILPSLTHDSLGIASMTPAPRYAALSATMLEQRGEHFRVHIHRIDELDVTHQSVMLEAANTSFQLHWQVDPEDFSRMYNLA